MTDTRETPGAVPARRDAPEGPGLRVSFRRALGFGPGKARLLAAIAETGSISASAQRLEMSYRRAWALVEEMNAAFVQPLVVTHKGGNGGGGAAVSAVGFEVLRRYNAMDERVRDALAADLGALATLLDTGECGG